MIRREGKDGILIQIPERMKGEVTGLATGELISAIYGFLSGCARSLIHSPLQVIPSEAKQPGLLGDHEFIPFLSPRIEQAFIPLLEGLRALGFSFTNDEPGT